MFSFLQGYWSTSFSENEQQAAQKITSVYRSHLQQKRFLKIKHSAIQVQRRFRRQQTYRQLQKWRNHVRNSIYGNEFCYARDLRILLKYRAQLYQEIQDINQKIETEFECSF